MGKLPPTVWQLISTDCGAACLSSICRYYNCQLSLPQISCLFPPSRHGVSLLTLGRVARSLGFETKALKVGYDWLVSLKGKPCIAHWRGNHYIVVSRANNRRVIVMDPARGKITMSRAEFEEGWNVGFGRNQNTDIQEPHDNRGIVLALDVSERGLSLPAASLKKDCAPDGKTTKIKDIVFPFRKYIIWISGLFIAIGLVDVLLPLLTRALFDEGIGGKSVYVILLVLGGQLCITVGKSAFAIVRSFIILHGSNKLYIELTIRLLTKFIRLPRNFFDFKSTGETLQTSFDVSRIDMFMTSVMPQVITAGISVVISTVMLLYLSPAIVGLYIPFLILLCLWMGRYLKKRRQIDTNLYELESVNNDLIIEYVRGISELKLTGADCNHRQKWLSNREKYYGLSRRSLAVDQSQETGVTILSRIADLAITLVTALSVISGDMSIGTMMAIQYLAGSLSYPAQELVMFLRQIQDYRISSARISGVYSLPDESNIDNGLRPEFTSGVEFKGVTMAYNPEDGNVLDDITFRIPKGSTIALVGESGSGKSSILKLILGIYRPDEGSILIDGNDINEVNISAWRSFCMTAFCDNYIFDDTLSANIALGESDPDDSKLADACKMACLEDVIKSLPNGLSTHLGPNGSRLSNGQRQRVILARAFYFHPSVLVLDEATNALDSHTEKIVYQNIYSRFKDATVIVAAHRLSTISHADNIIVLNHGRIVESGTHSELMKLGGYYAQSSACQSMHTEEVPSSEAAAD